MREVQSGIGFAFRPIQGVLSDVAGGVASIGAAITEIDRLRVDNGALPVGERAAGQPRTPACRRSAARTSCSPALLQLRAGFDYETVAASVIARESSEFRRVVTIDKGARAGIASGDVVVAGGGALVGRVTEVGPDSATVVLLTDSSSTVIGQLVSNAATGRGGRPARRGAGDGADRLDAEVVARRRGRDAPASSSAAASARRTPRAC